MANWLTWQNDKGESAYGKVGKSKTTSYFYYPEETDEGCDSLPKVKTKPVIYYPNPDLL